MDFTLNGGGKQKFKQSKYLNKKILKLRQSLKFRDDFIKVLLTKCGT